MRKLPEIVGKVSTKKMILNPLEVLEHRQTLHEVLMNTSVLVSTFTLWYWPSLTSRWKGNKIKFCQNNPILYQRPSLQRVLKEKWAGITLHHLQIASSFTQTLYRHIPRIHVKNHPLPVGPDRVLRWNILRTIDSQVPFCYSLTLKKCNPRLKKCWIF